jgi:hypothetical protein
LTRLRSYSSVATPLVLAVLVVLLAMVIAACGTTKTDAPEKATKAEPYKFEEEGDIPPLEEADVVTEADVEEIPVDQDEIVGENVVPPKDTTKVAGGGPAGVAGKDGGVAIPVYRVQILATTSEQSAQDAKKRVEKRLNFAAYISFEDGMYKVRVGDAATREEANKIRERCRAGGYSDAWIVTDLLKSE